MNMPAAILAFVGLTLASAPSNAFTYDDYAAVLAARVGPTGLVDYAALSESPEKLDAFTASLAAVTRDAYDAWNDDTKVAFWINAYNALTLKLIADRHPIEGRTNPDYPAGSIRQIPGAWDRVTFPVMGEEMTLDHIEHGILREKFSEARIHFALVCAALSCPPLRAEPFRGGRLDEQLDDQARRFLDSPRGLVIDRDGGVVWLSAIFDWFRGDFVEQYQGAGGAVVEFVGRHVSPDDRRYLETGTYDVKTLEYDWALNTQAK